MKAIFNTRSNYKNANGIRLTVIECNGTRITCEVPYYGFSKNKKEPQGKMIHADFNISELVGLYF